MKSRIDAEENKRSRPLRHGFGEGGFVEDPVKMH